MAITSVKFGTSAGGANSGLYSPTQNPNIGTDISKQYDGIRVKKSLGGQTYTFANHESSIRKRRLVYENITEAKFKGKTVTLNKPMRGDSKKFKVYVNSGKKNADGSIKVKKVNFGHGGTSAKRPTMRIRKSNPKRRKAFRARHRCDSPGPKTMARYWSCKKW